MRVAACVWMISPELVHGLDEHLGTPLDSYVNGSQVWLTDDASGGIVIEWRLHPVADYRAPSGCSHYEIWDAVVAELAGGSSPAAIRVGDDTRPLSSLWDGLECYAAHGEEIEPRPLADAATARLGIGPDHHGLVDHDAVTRIWERRGHGASLVALVVDQLTS